MWAKTRHRLAKKHFGDQAVVSTNQTLARHRMTPDGEVVREGNFDPCRDIATLKDSELYFLDVWRESGWNNEEACRKSRLGYEEAKRLCRKLARWHEESLRVEALAKVPTPSWIAAKDVKNVYDGGSLSDSAHKSLERLAKITGAFKTSDVSITQNVFNLPKLSPEVEAQFRVLAEQALEAEVVEKVA